MAIANTKFNIVRFGNAAIQLESPWKMTAGLKPDFNRATCTYLEFAKLTIGAVSTVQFYFNDVEVPDLTIANIKLVDAQPLSYGQDSRSMSIFQPIKYRLRFTDSRYGFVDPRGGRLVGGVINPSTETPPFPDRMNVPNPQSMDSLITACIRGMGISATAPSSTAIAPNDLKWFGTHAPSELDKLLGMSDMIFCLQPDGTYGIFNRNTGSDPAIPYGSALPPATLAGADGRATTVVFASYPTQVTNTLTQTDLNSGDLIHCYRNTTTNAWQAIDASGAFTSTAITEMNSHFPNTPDPQLQSDCYRYIRLNPDRFDPINAPILRKTYPPAGGSTSGDPSGLPPLCDIVFKAMIAVQDPKTKQWMMPGAKVQIPVDRIIDGNVMCFSSRLVKLQSGVTSTSDLEGNCSAIDLDSDISITFSVGSAPWDSTQLEYIPEYFYVGFNGSPSSPSMIDSAACASLLTQPDTITIPVHELAAMRYGMTADPTNKTALQNQVQPIAGRYLQDASKPPRVLSGVGFFPFTFNGRITEVEIDQQAIETRFKVDAWFRPAGEYLAAQFSHLRKPKESHPHEARTAGKRSAQGAAASAAPVQPMQPYVPPSSPSNVVAITISSSSGAGVYGGSTLTGTATAHSGTSITGMTSGSTVIIYNGPELGTSSANPYIITPAIASGLVIGKDATSGNQIVLVAVTSLGAC